MAKLMPLGKQCFSQARFRMGEKVEMLAVGLFLGHSAYVSISMSAAHGWLVSLVLVFFHGSIFTFLCSVLLERLFSDSMRSRVVPGSGRRLFLA